jgi:hypothetical protein
MRRLAAASLLVASLTASAAPAARAAPASPGAAARSATPDPCAAAKLAIPERLDELVQPARAELDAYRASWRAACDRSRGAADLAALLAEADALVTDVRTGRTVAALARALERDAPWPLPGIHRHGEVVDVDWATFSAFVPYGTAEDGRYFRGLARATQPDGDPAWIGDAAPGDGAPCLRLGQTAWAEVAQGIEEMERSRGEPYARRAALLRDLLMAALDGLGGGGVVCGCLRGDPLPALESLAAMQRSGTPARRALVTAAEAAADALRTGRTRVTWLREAPGAPVTGCAGPR